MMKQHFSSLCQTLGGYLIPLGLEEKRVHRVFVKETVSVFLFFVFLKIVNDLSVLNMLCPWRQNCTC